MRIHAINDLSNNYITNLLLCEFKTITINDEIYINYHPDCSDNPANIFYILNDTNGRYKTGRYYVIENNGNFICSAGWNEFSDNNNIALALTRAYVNKKYRSQFYMGKYILPEIISDTVNYASIYITVNSYNFTIYQWFLRAHENKSTSISTQWPDLYKLFKPIGIKKINNTDQYVLEYCRHKSKI